MSGSGKGAEVEGQESRHPRESAFRKEGKRAPFCYHVSHAIRVFGTLLRGSAPHEFRPQALQVRAWNELFAHAGRGVAAVSSQVIGASRKNTVQT